MTTNNWKHPFPLLLEGGLSSGEATCGMGQVVLFTTCYPNKGSGQDGLQFREVSEGFF